MNGRVDYARQTVFIKWLGSRIGIATESMSRRCGMVIKPFRNGEDHNKALLEVQRRWGAAKGLRLVTTWKY